VAGGGVPNFRALGGGYLASFPLALARLGASVTLSEVYGYYEAIRRPHEYLVSKGVTVWKLDLTRDGRRTPVGERLDAILNMAMLEHFAEFPRPLIETCTCCWAP
jgi:2-polyprenyl-3-methyl-5-hydroxy-6-metoxy-1,4-benzoquinol methylase